MEERNPLSSNQHNFLVCSYSPGHLFVNSMNSQRPGHKSIPQMPPIKMWPRPVPRPFTRQPGRP